MGDLEETTTQMEMTMRSSASSTMLESQLKIVESELFNKEQALATHERRVRNFRDQVATKEEQILALNADKDELKLKVTELSVFYPKSRHQPNHSLNETKNYKHS
jgi:chromosome segregation ATPase